MHVFAEIVAGFIVGVMCGFGFRGLISREKTQIASEIVKTAETVKEAIKKKL